MESATSLQHSDKKSEQNWAKIGMCPKHDAEGIQLWTNYNHRYSAMYFTADQVREMTSEEKEAYQEQQRQKKREANAKYRAKVKYAKGLRPKSDWIHDGYCLQQGKYPVSGKGFSLLSPYETYWHEDDVEPFQPTLPTYSDIPLQRNTIDLSVISDDASIIIDMETTGTDFRTDEILQLSIIDASTGKTIIDTYVRPIRHSNWPKAEKIHNITPEMVVYAPTLEELKPSIHTVFSKTSVVIAYNTRFIFSMLSSWGIDKYPYDWKPSIVDIMTWFTPIYEEWSYSRGDYVYPSLLTCAEYYGYDWGDTKNHDSLADCKAIAYCWKALVQASQEEP